MSKAYFIPLDAPDLLPEIPVRIRTLTCGEAPTLVENLSRGQIEYDPTIYQHVHGRVYDEAMRLDRHIVAGRSGMRAILELLSCSRDTKLQLEVILLPNDAVCINDLGVPAAESRGWGRNFESIMTQDRTDESPYIEAATLQIPFGKRQESVSLTVVGETDCLDMNGNAVELKTIRRGARDHYTHKYFQVLLSNVSRIIIGRIDNLVQPNTFHVEELTYDDLKHRAFNDENEILRLLHMFCRVISCLVEKFHDKNVTLSIEERKGRACLVLKEAVGKGRKKKSVDEDGFITMTSIDYKYVKMH